MMTGPKFRSPCAFYWGWSTKTTHCGALRAAGADHPVLRSAQWAKSGEGWALKWKGKGFEPETYSGTYVLLTYAGDEFECWYTGTMQDDLVGSASCSCQRPFMDQCVRWVYLYPIKNRRKLAPSIRICTQGARRATSIPRSGVGVRHTVMLWLHS